MVYLVVEGPVHGFFMGTVCIRFDCCVHPG